MTAQEAHRRTLWRMARQAQARGDREEARRLDQRILQLAKEQANADRRTGQ